MDPSPELSRYFFELSLVQQLQQRTVAEGTDADVERKCNKSVELILLKIDLDAIRQSLFKPLQILCKEVEHLFATKAGTILNRSSLDDDLSRAQFVLGQKMADPDSRQTR